tara:strand:+ start:4733 stop:6037 length:1305 start_codon:yes stop_codon:yes gene_type:complete
MSTLTEILASNRREKESKRRYDEEMAFRLLQLEMQQDWKNKSIELEASKSLYNENVMAHKQAQADLTKLETKYQEAVGSLDLLDESYKKSGLEVAQQIYQGDATNYQARADMYLDNTQAIKNKISVLEDLVYGDIKRSKNIMAGGFGHKGGGDTEAWDLGDLGIVSYEAMYGTASPTVEAMFANNPGVMVKELANLQKTEKALESTGQKIKYHKGLNEERRTQKAREEANMVFGMALSSAEKQSDYAVYKAYGALQSNLENIEENEVQIAEYKQERNKIKATIGAEFATLLGRPLNDTNVFDLSMAYMEMHDVGAPTTAVRTTTLSGEFSLYNNYIQEAAKNYQAAISSGDNDKARELNKLAMKYLGMPQGVQLNSFAKDMNDHYSKTIMGAFNSKNDSSHNLINDENEEQKQSSTFTDANSWESLLDGDDDDG